MLGTAVQTEGNLIGPLGAAISSGETYLDRARANGMVAYVLTLGRLVLAGGFALCLAVLAVDGHVSTGAAIVLLAMALIEEMTDIFGRTANVIPAALVATN